MSKLWIAHRNPSVRAALARAAGLPSGEVAQGEPSLAAFAQEPPPRALVLALSNDFATELAFAESALERSPEASLILLCARDYQAAVAARLTRPSTTLLDSPPDPRRLRAELASALARRGARDPGAAAETASPSRSRRFRAYFDEREIPELGRACDPALRSLPLLVRGPQGSGRALLIEEAERARGGARACLRIDARELADVSDLVTRIRVESERRGAAPGTVWIDEIDQLPDPVQRRLADWIDETSVPSDGRKHVDGKLRWLATAGPDDLGSRLAPALVRALAPLTLCVPSLSQAGDAIARVAEYTAREWRERFGGEPRRFREDALAALSDLATERGWLERSELEAILWTSLAACRTNELEAADLRFPGAATGADANPGNPAVAASTPSAPTTPSAPQPFAAPLDLALDRDADPSNALLGLTVAIGGADEPSAPAPDPSWRRLARSLAHEIRNPLVSIRTFSELLPDHYADETFRARFKELVGQDVAHIQHVVTRLAQAAERNPLERKPVDVSALVDRLLAARREVIVRRRLVVLCELERDQPAAESDGEALELAIGGLLDRALDALPDRGDLFLTTHRIAGDADRPPRLRLLLRHHDPAGGGAGGELDPLSHILEYVLAETLVTALGGRMTIDPTLGPQTLIVVDLPAA